MSNKPLFALIDCNNFYVSCERVFQPELRGKAGVVLSNNDGCAIARSQEAKDLGIKMGCYIGDIMRYVEQGKLWVRSSNYTLYQDMMRRVTHIIQEMWPEMEIYSIDESFCDLRMFDRFDVEQMALELREQILQCTGIPVCIGIGPTKTLAKAANRTAKKHFKEKGVYCINSEESRKFALMNLPIEDVWGIGPKNAAKLISKRYVNAWQFSLIKNQEVIQNMFHVPGVRTWYELNGTVAYKMEYNPPDKKGISTGRSFGTKMTEYKYIEDALCAFVQNSAVKVREQELLVGMLQVTLYYGQFDVVNHFPNAGYTIEINPPTNLTQELNRYAISALKKIFVQGREYQKVAVYMTKFSSESANQLLLHEDTAMRDKMEKLSHLTDKLNLQWGKDKVRFAAMGYNPIWKMRQEYLSQKYTTRIEDVLVIDTAKVFKRRCELF